MIRKNPLSVVGRINRCWLFAYATPEADARQLVPPELEVVTRDGFAFWNIVVSSIQNMRPSGMPWPFGVSYWHVAYRLYVRFQPRQGTPIEGLYFLRSDCSNAFMGFAGNLLTDFHFHAARIELKHSGAQLELQVNSSSARASARLRYDKTPILRPGSSFASLEAAATFLKYKPYGISIERGQANIVRITRREADWRSRPVYVEEAHWQYFEDKTVHLELCSEVAPIDYRWNRGEIVTAAGRGNLDEAHS